MPRVRSGALRVRLLRRVRLLPRVRLLRLLRRVRLIRLLRLVPGRGSRAVARARPARAPALVAGAVARSAALPGGGPLAGPGARGGARPLPGSGVTAGPGVRPRGGSGGGPGAGTLARTADGTVIGRPGARTGSGLAGPLPGVVPGPGAVPGTVIHRPRLRDVAGRRARSRPTASVRCGRGFGGCAARGYPGARSPGRVGIGTGGVRAGPVRLVRPALFVASVLFVHQVASSRRVPARTASSSLSLRASSASSPSMVEEPA
ncbi:hypothetical protein BDW27_10990 [Nocardiopsis sp. L17-MgMaSL7]|nr:hypothetical protein BDW27_10990 [Nocardiopsis sp. L17-MgMaSL7]